MSTIELRPAPRSSIAERGRMLMATKTTEVKGEDGTPERLTAGQTFVDSAHFLCKRYPHLFEPDKRRARQQPPRARRSATPTRAPAHAKARSQETTLPPWKPLVRLDTRAAPTFTVRISDPAYVSIGDQAFAQRGTVETGGALFGHPATNGSTSMLLKRALPPGPRTHATSSSLDLDRGHVHAEVDRLRKQGSPVTWVGSWHTHPWVGSLEPSDGDLKAFALDCRQIRHLAGEPEHYVGLILSPTWERGADAEDYMSWAKPTITAWHMNPVAADQFICSRAEVVRP